MSHVLGCIDCVENYCNPSNDSYNEVCNDLPRLCPRLVPSPLWGLSLARVARMAPEAGLAICDKCPEIVEGIHRFWMLLDRSGACEVCGERGNEIDEDWLYCVFDREGNIIKDIAEKNPSIKELEQYRGIAYLQKLRLLCPKCHLAKHSGYARVHGRLGEALEHLAGITNLSLEKAEKIVSKAFHIHSLLSNITDWTIRIGELKGLDEELRRKAERLLNIMYEKGFSLSGGWLKYEYSLYGVVVEPRIMDEIINVLAMASKESGTNNVADEKWVYSLINIVKTGLEERGIRVLEYEFRLFTQYLLENVLLRKFLEKIVECIMIKGESERCVPIVSSSLGIEGFEGKWMVFLPKDVYPIVFRRIVDALEKSRLAYQAEIVSKREEYGSKRELPLLVKVPIPFVPKYVADVAEVIKSVLGEFNINKRMYFKPELFTLKSRSRTMGHKQYIYMY